MNEEYFDPTISYQISEPDQLINSRVFNDPESQYDNSYQSGYFDVQSVQFKEKLISLSYNEQIFTIDKIQKFPGWLEEAFFISVVNCQIECYLLHTTNDMTEEWNSLRCEYFEIPGIKARALRIYIGPEDSVYLNKIHASIPSYKIVIKDRISNCHFFSNEIFLRKSDEKVSVTTMMKNLVVYTEQAYRNYTSELEIIRRQYNQVTETAQNKIEPEILKLKETINALQKLNEKLKSNKKESEKKLRSGNYNLQLTEAINKKLVSAEKDIKEKEFEFNIQKNSHEKILNEKIHHIKTLESQVTLLTKNGEEKEQSLKEFVENNKNLETQNRVLENTIKKMKIEKDDCIKDDLEVENIMTTLLEENKDLEESVEQLNTRLTNTVNQNFKLMQNLDELMKLEGFD